MENNSIRGRYSLSTSNLTSPIAESTCLNGSSSDAKFNWGGGTISSRNRNNSHMANKSATMSKNLNGTPPKIAMSPTSRIDPRTYVDIHSNGLASRIVKYHDNNSRLNRSLSMGNLYNKPGQFPVVHLKKNEQQYKAKKSRNLSMTRIAAPEKSVFHGNTLSSILRSGSIVGIQKSDEEISRENRPILHPPPTENEMAPTRSVLEVLKEISRKRINSDELDGTELIKKHCKEPVFDTIPYTAQNTQSKRQREISTSAASNAQISPEQQVVKKRMCNYNNDILSSLSSSMLSVNKKKMIEMQSQKRTASDVTAGNTSSTSSTDVESSRSEKLRCMGSFEFEHLAPSNKYTPISPLPNTPSTGVGDELNKTRKGLVARRASEPVINNTKPKLTLFNKDYDEMPTKVRNDIAESREDGDMLGIQFVKPKKTSSMSTSGTLLMEKTKKSKLALMLSGLKGELNEEDEIDAPLKIQPQKEAHVMVNVTRSSDPSVLSTQSAITFGTNTTSSTTVTPAPDTISKTVAESSLTMPTAVKGGLQFNLPTVTASESSAASNDVKISVTATVTGTSSIPAVVSLPATTTPTLTSSLTSTATSIPTLGGFSFGLKSTPSLTATTSAVSSQPIVPQVTIAMPISGANLAAINTEIKPFAFGVTSTSTPPSYTFGTPNTISLPVPATQVPSMPSAFTSTNTKTIDAPPPIFGQISTVAQPTMSFGSLAASNPNSTTNSLTASTSTPSTTSAAPAFKFGGAQNSWSQSATQAPSNANAITSLGSFGGIATSTSVPQSTATLTATTSAGGFSFAGPSSNEATKTLFANMIPATTTPSNSNVTFSLNTNKTLDAQANPSNTFTFGSPAAPSSTMTNPSQPPMFGNATLIKPSNSFAFGAPVAATPIKASFSFPSADKPALPITTTSNSVGGFSFNAPPVTNSLPVPDPNKNIFETAAPAAAASKPVFSFGGSSNQMTSNKPPMFGAAAVKPTILFGAPTTTTAQNSPFAFGPSNGSTNQGAQTAATNTMLFGAAPASHQTSGLGATTSSSGSIFGPPSAAVAPLQQSSTFNFGASSNNTTAETNKPAGGFVFGSSSSIGSNASKPAADMNKTFVFGDGSTTITPAPPGTTNLFGGSNATNSGSIGATENKIFSFGGGATSTTGNNNAFGSTRSTINQSPVFSFGPAAPSNPSPAQNGNLFAPQAKGGAPSTMMTTVDRPIRKAMRRLNKT